MTGVLDGIRVLDFGRYIAGPFCATMLGDLGADVIRVERRDGSEDRYLQPVAQDGTGGMFLQMGRNKRSVTLDPMLPDGREVVRRLVATADVVVANLPPQTLAAMGLDYDSLKAVRNDIILTTVSAFGSGGPYSHKVGFDSIGQAMSGAMYLTGEPDEPMRAFASYVDFGTALLCAIGTLAALIERQSSGVGQQVEGSLLGTALAFNNATLIEQGVIQRNRIATKSRGQFGAPVDAFKTSDGWIFVHILGAPLFKRWVALIGEDHWLADPRFKDDISRGDNGEIVSTRMAEWCSGRSTEQALAELEEARIPAGPVYTPQQALDDPHVIARQIFKLIDYPGLPRPAPVADTPVALSRTPAGIRRRAPTLGEDTDDVLTELGYDAAAIAELRRRSVI